MPFVIDTNVAIHLRDGDPGIVARIQTLSEFPMISVVTRVELEGGLGKQPDLRLKRRNLLDAMLATLPVLPFQNTDAVAYGTIVAAIGFSRTRILDRMIAAQAVAAGARLITINGKDFADIPGLDLEVWPTP